MQTRIRIVAMALALIGAVVTADAAQSGAKDEKKKEGTTVSGTAKATGHAAKKGAKKTGKGAKKAAKKTAKGGEKTAHGAKKAGAGVKHTVTGGDKDKQHS